ncbi:neural-cadherin 2-like 1, partial [Homarus americanus]
TRLAGGDEGRGVGVVSTVGALDREERPVLLVPLVVRDAGSLSATVTLTLHVADLNDNPMYPASKTVTVNTVQPQGSTVPLGRVYVKDPDDWDAASKTYSWRNHQPGFSLTSSTGDLTMAPDTPPGRYQLGFWVSDASQGQNGVMANVTVEVKSVTSRDVTQATLLTLEVDPYQAIKEDGQVQDSIVHRLEVTLQAWLKGHNREHGVRAWVDEESVGMPRVTSRQGQEQVMPTTRVWVVSPGVSNLNDVLVYHRKELAEVLGVGIQDIGVATCQESTHQSNNTPTKEPQGCVGGCWARTVLEDGYSVVDAHSSSLVGPRVHVHRGCGCVTPTLALENTCTSETCLNGGRCIPTSTGTRCICPYGTWGSRCKVLSRYFEGAVDPGGGEASDSGGWAWVPSIPACVEVHISLEILTTSLDGTLLYSGPFGEDKAPVGTTNIEGQTDSSVIKDVTEGALRQGTDFEQRPMKANDWLKMATRRPTDTVKGSLPGQASDVVLVELRGGRPSFLLDLGGGAVTLSLNASYSLADNTWHRIDLIWKDELVEMIVDLCSGSSVDALPMQPSSPTHTILPDAHTCRGAARLPKAARVLNTDQPLQLVDMGEAVLARHSSPGCSAADCLSAGLHCGLHARCHGSPRSLRCECQPGWAGSGCATPTTPTNFQVNSYVKLALSFTPLGYTTTITLRFRTRQQQGQLIGLSSQSGQDHFTLQLVDGQLCVLLQFHPDPARSLCLARAKVTDGHWHTAATSRQGTATFLAVDDGDGDLYNASVSLEGRQLLEVDDQEGVHVGGTPEYVGVSVFQIHGDYHDGCIDDLRISGRSVPLPPTVNTTAWTEAGVFKGVEPGCGAPPACANVSCRAPLSCVDTWRSYQCGCGAGRVLSNSRGTCHDHDLCVWRPCLNGGSCFNKPSAGYVCACPAGFSGQHCHLPDAGETSLKLSLGALVAILVWCAFLLLLICAFLLHQHHKRSAVRRGMAGEVKENSGVKEETSPPSTHTPNLLELQLLKPPKANGQPAWTTKNPNIADVDVLQVDAASVTSSMEDQRRYCSSLTMAGVPLHQGGGDKGREMTPSRNKNGASRGGTRTPSPGDDLRNYAYEGEGSSPGSLSSCLESCSGSAKFLGGFREVAHMLES